MITWKVVGTTLAVVGTGISAWYAVKAVKKYKADKASAENERWTTEAAWKKRMEEMVDQAASSAAAKFAEELMTTGANVFQQATEAFQKDMLDRARKAAEIYKDVVANEQTANEQPAGEGA